MLFKVQKDTEKINSRVLKTKNDKAMISSKCAIYGSTKSRVIEKQEAKGLLSSLALKAPLKKIPLLGDILF